MNKSKPVHVLIVVENINGKIILIKHVIICKMLNTKPETLKLEFARTRRHSESKRII